MSAALRLRPCRTALLVHEFSSRAHCALRAFATESLPRPPPSQIPDPVTFSEPSKPRQYYARPAPKRDLPPLQNTWPLLLALGAAGVAGWATFLMYATNAEMLASSVVRQVLKTLREDAALRAVLGDAVRPEPAWYMNGAPWITGNVNALQGHVDVSFRIKGHKGAGTLYFTSIRKAKGEPFTILRFKVIADDGTVVNIDTT